MSNLIRMFPTEYFLYGLIGAYWCLSSVGVTSELTRHENHSSCSHSSPTSIHTSFCKMVEVENLLDLAIERFDVSQKMKNYIDGGGNPNLIESTGQKCSLLEMFSFAGHDTFVTRLLTCGASVDYADANGHNALYQASVAGKLDIINILITHVINTKGKGQELSTLINATDTRGITSLHMASVKGYDTIVEALLRNRAAVDQADDQGRTALHFACYMGHESVVRHLIGHNAQITLTTREGLTPRDFFKLGELKEDVRRSNVIENLITDTERRLGIQHEDNKAGQRITIRQNATLSVFMETFQRKCGSVFLAYRALESEAIQNTTDTFTVSNMLNILGNVAPLPGSGLVFTALSYGAESLEDSRETTKRETLTHFFTTIRDMENEVEQAAYDLTCIYKEKIVQLTVDGARTLALCGVGRFVEFMRESAPLNKQHSFSELVISSVQRVKSNTILDALPWTKIKIETKDKTIKWTERSVFQEFNSLILTKPDVLLATSLSDERAIAHQADSNVVQPTTEIESAPQPHGAKMGGCCTIS